ncbi:uncharacterized protein [Palaemon carinicauda]
MIYHIHLFDKTCKNTTCGENEYCKEIPSTFSFRKENQIVCMCNPGFLRINSDCREASHQKVLESCYIPENGTVKSCDVDESSVCNNGKCVCFESHFANVTSKKCEPKADYMKAHNLTEYRVRPGEYCLKESDCISGLECSNYQCDCPWPCSYNKTAEICDCGVIEKRQVEITGPAIVGVLLGLCICAFWFCMIKITITKYAKKKNVSLIEVTPAEEPHPTLALQPMSPRNKNVENATSGEVTAPTGIPEKPPSLPVESNSEINTYIPPPQPSQYSFSIPGVSSALPPFSPGAPASYSLLSTTDDSPPPYSLNPQDGTFNVAIPDSSIPSYLPYSNNTATPNPSTDGSTNPSGPYGTTAPVLDPSTVYPCPVSPTISGPISATPSLPSAPPYALGSNSASAPKKD